MMNKKAVSVLTIAVLVISVSLNGCGRGNESIVTNKDDSLIFPEEASETISLPSSEEEDLVDTLSSDEAKESEDSSAKKEARGIDDTFEEAVAYINRSGGVTPEIDYDTIKYKAAERDAKVEVDKKAPKEIESGIKEDKVRTVRMLRSGNGATLDFTVYTDPESGYIDKIVSTEYGSAGREITGYYYKKGAIIYTYRYLDDLYGINANDARKSGGKRCFFKNDFLAEVYATYGESNESVTAATYADVNPDIQKEYDELEEELINRAYVTYNTLKGIPSTAKVFGYVADEYGGTLANTEVTISS